MVSTTNVVNVSKEELDFNCRLFKSVLRKYIRFEHVSRFHRKLLMHDKRIQLEIAINKFSQEDENIIFRRG